MTGARFFDITFADAEGNPVEPQGMVDVRIEYQSETIGKETGVEGVHFTEEGAETIDVQAETSDSASKANDSVNVDAVSFQNDAFSVYGFVYTVDFHYGVDGNVYDYSIPGGGFIRFSDLVRQFGIVEDEKVQAFTESVANVQFSSPALLHISKVEEDTTVGAIKETYGLQSHYSADMSEAEIEEINASQVRAVDWVLISLLPFDTEETLTVTMKDGEKFEILVTDAKIIYDVSTVDVNKSYLIGTKVGDDYHLLKTDGSQAVVGPDSFDKLDSSYQWTFYYVFTEKDRETSLDYTYYFIRPVTDKTKTIALNEAGEPLVQEGTNNIAVIPYGEGGFVFLGYNHSENKHIELGFDEAAQKFIAYNDSKYLDPDDDPTIIRIFEQEPLPQYSFTVQTANSEMGLVSGLDESGHQSGNTSQFIGLTNTDKKNAGQIRAVPADHKNGDLGPWDQGYGQNKWVFDYWDLNGTKLEGMGATINPLALEIPYNGSVLTAHFKQNTAYVVPNSEKQGSSFEDMTGWLNEILNSDLPLNKDATKIQGSCPSHGCGRVLPDKGPR